MKNLRSPWTLGVVLGMVGCIVLGIMLLQSPLTPLLLRAQPISGNFTFCFPASQMAPRAKAFRDGFVRGYLTPQNPYPVFTAMYQARIAPISSGDEQQLGKRGPFLFASPSTMFNDGSAAGICAPGPVCNSASFSVQLGGSTSIVKVDFAPRIDVTVSEGSALTFDFGAGIPLHIQNPGSSGLPLLRPDMFYRKVSIADTYMDEVVSNPGTGNGDALQITAHLDFTDACPAPAANDKKGGKK